MPLHLVDGLVCERVDEALGRLRGDVQERFERIAVHLELRAAHRHGLVAGRRERRDRVHLHLAVATDLDGLIGPDGVRQPLGDPRRLVGADLQRGIVADGARLVAPHARLGVVRGHHLHVTLRVHHDLFLPGLVLEADLVVPAPAWRRVRLQGRARLALGQRVGRHDRPVVEPPRDQRPVGVPLQELDDHLPADARQHHRARGLHLGDPDPARRLVVLHLAAIPAELDLAAPVLVGVDRLLRRPFGRHHGGRLRPLDDGHGRLARRPELRGDGEQPRAHHVRGPVRARARARAIPARLAAGMRALPLATVHVAVVRREHEVLPAGLVGVGDRELLPHRDPRAVGVDLDRAPQHLLLLEARLGEPLPFFRLPVPAGVVVDLQPRPLLALLCGGEVEPWPLEVVVAQGELPGAHPLLPAQHVDRVARVGERGALAQRQLRRAADRPRGGAVVGEDELLPGRGRLHEAVDALVLAEPRDEGQRALLVLHAVRPLRVAPREPPLHPVDLVALKHVGDDLLHRHVLVDARVHAPIEQVKRRDQAQQVVPAQVAHALVGPTEHRGCLDEAGEHPRLVARDAERERRRHPQEIAWIQVPVDVRVHLDHEGPPCLVDGVEGRDPRGGGVADGEMDLEIACHRRLLSCR
ncbi:Hypothetical protein CAP_4658 [Chondromyces apiculatus DSM 436]|uniref:Uncharacterized protein n=1 Tax=Chondromyces apiculatus DSM 436 TaxID=1192034 RepID=A0A017T6I3_9BACT|nr:Hypothetical protein CAP_4658 [Chondromyces apiculatus DSM 436]